MEKYTLIQHVILAFNLLAFVILIYAFVELRGMERTAKEIRKRLNNNKHP